VGCCWAYRRETATGAGFFPDFDGGRRSFAEVFVEVFEIACEFVPDLAGAAFATAFNAGLRLAVLLLETGVEVFFVLEGFWAAAFPTAKIATKHVSGRKRKRLV